MKENTKNVLAIFIVLGTLTLHLIIIFIGLILVSSGETPKELFGVLSLVIVGTMMFTYVSDLVRAYRKP